LNVVPVNVADHDVPLGIPFSVIVIGYVITVQFIELLIGFPFTFIVPEYELALYPDIT